MREGNFLVPEPAGLNQKVRVPQFRVKENADGDLVVFATIIQGELSGSDFLSHDKQEIQVELDAATTSTLNAFVDEVLKQWARVEGKNITLADR